MMTDWAQVSEAPRWQSETGSHPWRRVTQLVARLATRWRERRGRIHVSRLSDEWLRNYEIDAVKHRNDL